MESISKTQQIIQSRSTLIQDNLSTFNFLSTQHAPVKRAEATQ